MSHIIPDGVPAWLYWLMVAATLLSMSAVVIIWLNLSQVRGQVRNGRLAPRSREEYKRSAAYGARAFDGAVGSVLLCIVHLVAIYLAPLSLAAIVTRWLVIVPVLWCIYSVVRMQMALHYRWRYY